MLAIGILGVGRLGSALVPRLSRKHERLIYDWDVPKAAKLASATGSELTDPVTIVSECDLILICVPPGEIAKTAQACRAAAETKGVPLPLLVNLCTSISTEQLRGEIGLSSLELVGLKPICQFTALGHGLPTTFVTSAADRLSLFDRALDGVGTVLLGAEDEIGRLNRIATRASLLACANLRHELSSITCDERFIQAAITNVFAGTAADYPPDPANEYTSALMPGRS